MRRVVELVIPSEEIRGRRDGIRSMGRCLLVKVLNGSGGE